MVTLLFTPFLITAQIILGTFFSSENVSAIGHYRRIYESSILHKFIRVFIFLFQYISLPIWTSVGIKMFILESQSEDAQNEVAFGTVILIMTPLAYIIG